jgi:glycosyltransferase A (GT-A) superfamily protein (DUF2064 family)
VRKILFYAPANEEGHLMMEELLRELDLKSTSDIKEGSEGWMLLPMVQSSDLRAKNLGDNLTDILKRIHNLCKGKTGRVVLLGMDSPELPLEEIETSLFGVDGRNDDKKGKQTTAFLCPANDGGYGMLCLPPQVPIEKVFQGIRWSDPLTALSQLKVLSDCRIPIRLGRLMNDIDEPGDVKALCQRLSETICKADKRVEQDNDDVLLMSSSCTNDYEGGELHTGSCQYTIITLQELGLLS